RLSHVFAARHRRNSGRVHARVHLQHGNDGQGPPARLAHGRSARALARTDERQEPLQTHEMAPSLPSVVLLRLRHGMALSKNGKRLHGKAAGQAAGPCAGAGSLKPNMPSGQAKHLEVEFFDRHATSGTEYNVFTEKTNERLIGACLERCGLQGGDRVLDLGCGSGVFSSRLAKTGLAVTGVDISPKLIEIGRKLYPEVRLEVGDAEALAFEDGAFDAVFLG